MIRQRQIHLAPHVLISCDTVKALADWALRVDYGKLAKPERTETREVEKTKVTRRAAVVDVFVIARPAVNIL